MKAAALLPLLAVASCDGCFYAIDLTCGGASVLTAQDRAAEKEVEALEQKCGACGVGEQCNFRVGRCTKSPGVEGTPCGDWYPDAGGDHRSFPCSDELWCHYGYDPPVCKKDKSRTGEPCYLQDDCAEGLFCSEGKCG